MDIGCATGWPLENRPKMRYTLVIMDAVELKSLYDTDELAWLAEQVDALRAGDLGRQGGGGE